jgi:zinc protease
MRPTPIALALASALAAAAPAAAAPAAARPRSPRPTATARLPAVETWKLDNGLEVAFSPRPGSPVVSVQVWYRAGSADDPAGKRGLARLFETLMFDGSTRLRPGDHRGRATTGPTSSRSAGPAARR